jgi:threonine aldolase
VARTPIDLRSDTVTRPTPGMRAAMAAAEVGDDVFDEDPTVHRLQDQVAEMLGKEAALFVPTGTMANQICVRVHTRPGDELICETTSHVYVWEAGGAERRHHPPGGRRTRHPRRRTAPEPDSAE